MINYQNLQDSITAYEEHGYQRVETPWCVTAGISDMTKPLHGTDYAIEHNEKVLVASGEQSFLYQYAKGHLPKGKFQTVTPCYRRENYDATHMKYFMKNELINTRKVDMEELSRMIDCAMDFFATKLDRDRLEVVQTGAESWDIVYMGIELGSYGIRRNEMLDWVYGTGCAEPRLSYAQNMQRNYATCDKSPDLPVFGPDDVFYNPDDENKNGRAYPKQSGNIDDFFTDLDAVPEVAVEDYAPEWSNKLPENGNLCCEIDLPGTAEVCAIVPLTEEEIAEQCEDIRGKGMIDWMQQYADFYQQTLDARDAAPKTCIAWKPQHRTIDLIAGGPSAGIEPVFSDHYKRRDLKSVFDFIGMVDDAKKAKAEEPMLVDDYDNDEGPFARVDASIEYMKKLEEERQAAEKAAKLKAFHDKLDASAKRFGLI